MTAACTRYSGKDIQPGKSPIRFSNKRFTGANSATPATMLTGAATYIRRDPVSGRKLRRGPIAHKIAPAVLRDFWFSILPEQIGNENSRNEKRKKRLVDCKNCKTRAAQTAHGKVGGAV